MAGRSQQEAAGVVGAYDFSGLRTLVDVGGGGGILLAAILRRADAPRRAARSGGRHPRCPSPAGGGVGQRPGDVPGRRLLHRPPGWGRRLPALTHPPRLGRRRRPTTAGGLFARRWARRSCAPRRCGAAGTGRGCPGRHPDGPAHAPSVRCTASARRPSSTSSSGSAVCGWSDWRRSRHRPGWP